MERDPLLEALRERFPIPSPTPFNATDFIHAVGSPLEALMYCRLFWPAFVEIDQMAFLQDEIEDAEDVERVRHALATFNGDKRMTQCSFNTIEVADLFGRRAGESTEEQYALLAETLAEMWRARLYSSFPDRKTHVAVEPPKGPAGVAVAFYIE